MLASSRTQPLGLYARAIEALAARTVMGAAVCEMVTDVSGPLDVTRGDEACFAVGADFYLRGV
jgi:hypothetical protein